MSKSSFRSVLRWVVPIIIIVAAYGAGMITDLLNSQHEGQAFQPEPPYLSAFLIEAGFVALATFLLVYLERDRVRILTHFRYSALLYPFAVLSLSGFEDAGHLTGLLRYLFALASGAILGNVFALWLYARLVAVEA